MELLFYLVDKLHTYMSKYSKSYSAHLKSHDGKLGWINQRKIKGGGGEHALKYLKTTSSHNSLSYIFTYSSYKIKTMQYHCLTFAEIRRLNLTKSFFLSLLLGFFQKKKRKSIDDCIARNCWQFFPWFPSASSD